MSIQAVKLDVDQVIREAFLDTDWMFKMGIGGTLNAICLVLALSSPFFAPLILASMALTNGYALRTARQIALNQDNKLPAWNNWLELLISGLSWFAVQLGFCLAIIAVVTIALLLGAYAGWIKMASSVFLFWAMTIVCTFSLFCAFVNFASRYLMVHFACEEQISAGFAIRELWRRVRHNPSDFIFIWLLGIGLYWLAIVIPVLTVFGTFLIPSSLFLSELIAARLAAKVWSSSQH